jgi:hypothetical protein
LAPCDEVSGQPLWFAEQPGTVAQSSFTVSGKWKWAQAASFFIAKAVCAARRAALASHLPTTAQAGYLVVAAFSICKFFVGSSHLIYFLSVVSDDLNSGRLKVAWCKRVFISKPGTVDK